jgi:hypothetical protein
LQGSIEEQPKIIGPASTLKLVEKSSDVPPLTESDPGVVPKGKHWVDMADEGTVVVIEQPSGQTCAALGGIMAARMKVRGVEACIVGGRVRDLAELRKSGLPVSDKQTKLYICVSVIALAFTFPPPNALLCPHPFFDLGSSATISFRVSKLCSAPSLGRHAHLFAICSAYIPFRYSNRSSFIFGSFVRLPR